MEVFIVWYLLCGYRKAMALIGNDYQGYRLMSESANDYLLGNIPPRYPVPSLPYWSYTFFDLAPILSEIDD